MEPKDSPQYQLAKELLYRNPETVYRFTLPSVSSGNREYAGLYDSLYCLPFICWADNSTDEELKERLFDMKQWYRTHIPL